MTAMIAHPPLAPGVYFDLDETRYHADSALGSSNIRAVMRSAPDYWWDSPMNPLRPGDKDTEARITGRAIHVLVFYGQARFAKEFIRRPDDPAGASSSTKAKITKAAKAELGDKQKLLKGEDYDRTLITRKLIDANQEMAGCFDGGFAEVSIFWERDGIRRKARFDYLKPRGVGDLKKITNTHGYDFPEACIRAINLYRYTIQGAHYLEARSFLPGLVSAGAVFGALKGKDKALLQEIAAEPEYAFQWVFFQGDGAPNVFSKILSVGNPVIDIARDKIDAAVERYKEYLARFGTDKIWVLAEPATELDISEMWQSYAR